MKKITTVFIAFLCVLSLFAEDQEKDIESKIEKVTVFINGAQVTRTAKAVISNGKTLLKFTGISPNLTPESVQVKADGNLTILSVTHQINYLHELPSTEEIERLHEMRLDIQDSINFENTYMSVLNDEEALLTANRDLGGKQMPVSMDELIRAVDYFHQRLLQTRKKKLLISKKIRDYNNEIIKINNQLRELNAQKKSIPTSEILVPVTTKASSANIDFIITYVVNGAGWHPTYDLRVENIKSPMDITYKANIYQSSGEDWKDVDLTISSGNPKLGGVRPMLRPWYLSFNQRLVYFHQQAPSVTKSSRQVYGQVIDTKTGEPLIGANVFVPGTNVGAVTDINGNYSMVVPQGYQNVSVSYIGYSTQDIAVYTPNMNFNMTENVQKLEEVVIASKSMRAQSIQKAPGVSGGSASSASSRPVPVQTVMKVTNFEFSIDIPYSIPSNGKKYTVEIETYELDAQYEYRTTPKLDEDAFLTAMVSGWGEYNFLNGEANIFFEGTYVTKTYLNVDNITDTLPVSLGRDENIVIKRTRQKDYEKKQFLSGNRKEAIGWEISVRNKKREPIRIIIDDQVPVSTTKEITVDILEISGAEHSKEKGFLRWEINVLPDETDKLEFRYTVKYPKKRTLILE